MDEAPLVDPNAPGSDSAPAIGGKRARRAAPEPTPPPAELAAEWMGAWGERDPRATSDVTVHAAEAVALVCCGITVGRAELNDLVEYTRATEQMRRRYLFGDRAFGRRTVSMADELEVALFWWDERGALHPAGVLADRVVAATAGDQDASDTPAGGSRRAVAPTEPDTQAPTVPAARGKRRAAEYSPTARASAVAGTAADDAVAPVQGRFADPNRRSAGGPVQAARGASRPAGTIDGPTADMIVPRQQPAPAQESLPPSKPRQRVQEPQPEAAPDQSPAQDTAAPAEPPERRRGWFSRRPRPETAARRRAPVSQRSYQMRRTLEARRKMLETGLPPVTDFPEAMDWLRRGDRARAIAFYRKTVGVGLVDAIDAIDALGGDY